MNQREQEVVEEQQPELVNQIRDSVDDVCMYLEVNNIITGDDHDTIKAVTTRSAKALTLLHILRDKDEGWTGLMEVLGYLKLDPTRKQIKDRICELYNKSLKSKSQPTTRLKRVDTNLDKLQECLADYIMNETATFKSYWQNFLAVNELEGAYQELEVSEVSAQLKGRLTLDDLMNQPYCEKRTINDYSYLTAQKFQRLFVVTGNAGIGKTTYVHNLAYKWADEDEYLREHFNHVFLVHLGKLGDRSLVQYIAQELNYDQEMIDPLLSSASTLIILDGFDELSMFNQYIESIVTEKQSRRQSKIILTTRSSELHRIKTNHMLVSIGGFTSSAIDHYIDLQITDEGRRNQLKELFANLQPELKCPLFAAILCTLQKVDFQNLKGKMSLYYMLNYYFEHLYNLQHNANENITRENFNDAMFAAGIFEYVTYLNSIVPIGNTFNETDLENAAKFGLLIKRSFVQPTGNWKSDFMLPNIIFFSYYHAFAYKKLLSKFSNNPIGIGTTLLAWTGQNRQAIQGNFVTADAQIDKLSSQDILCNLSDFCDYMFKMLLNPDAAKYDSTVDKYLWQFDIMQTTMKAVLKENYLVFKNILLNSNFYYLLWCMNSKLEIFGCKFFDVFQLGGLIAGVLYTYGENCKEPIFLLSNLNVPQKMCPKIDATMQNVCTLTFSHCSLSSTILLTIGSLENLTKLRIRYCNLDDFDCAMFQDSLQNQPQKYYKVLRKISFDASAIKCVSILTNGTLNTQINRIEVVITNVDYNMLASCLHNVQYVHRLTLKFAPRWLQKANAADTNMQKRLL